MRFLLPIAFATACFLLLDQSPERLQIPAADQIEAVVERVNGYYKASLGQRWHEAWKFMSLSAREDDSEEEYVRRSRMHFATAWLRDERITAGHVVIGTTGREKRALATVSAVVQTFSLFHTCEFLHVTYWVKEKHDNDTDDKWYMAVDEIRHHQQSSKPSMPKKA